MKGDLKSDGFETTLEIMVNRSYQIYAQICSDKEGIKFIWPNVLPYVMNSSYSPGLAVMLKHLGPMLNKSVDEFKQLNLQCKNLYLL